ncbi:MAG: hypothetical protein KDD33_10260 [Bdellovibrionales bacterium]|nr:hypothetical protein [Bdellovibrionales bacterium]
MPKKVLKICSITNLLKSSLDWNPVLENLKKEIEFEFSEIDQLAIDDAKGIREAIEGFDIILVDTYLRERLNRVVAHRSVNSHFLNYFDFLERKEGKLWGYSLFNEVFYRSMLGAIKNQDFKGPVIFLGCSPLLLPVIDVLGRFGFQDFVFLDIENDKEEVEKFLQMSKSLMGVHFSSVDSTAFIQSQKEYSLCFVVKNHYNQQILDDMSYFHFLSNRSIVFDLAGASNFLFKEVRALGVELVPFGATFSIFVEIFSNKIINLGKEMQERGPL